VVYFNLWHNIFYWKAIQYYNDKLPEIMSGIFEKKKIKPGRRLIVLVPWSFGVFYYLTI